MPVTLGDLEAVLREFVQDVEAVGPEEMDWPDLRVTYEKAKRVLADWVGEGELEAHPDSIDHIVSCVECRKHAELGGLRFDL